MILHLTNSTVAGAAAMLSAAQRAAGHESLCIQFSDVKPERLMFSQDILPLPLTDETAISIFQDILSRTKIVHVHNWLPGSVENKLLEILSTTDAQLVWHLHQGNLEHPVYRPDAPDVPWDKKIVVAHGFARTFDDFIVMPNCVYRPAATKVQPRPRQSIDPRKPLGVVFSPSSMTNSRWGAKTNGAFNQIVDSMKGTPFLQIFEAVGIHPSLLLTKRHYYDVTIDELITGSFHLVSYEGLMSGNVVFNNADELSMEIFCAALQAPEPPPFLKADPRSIMDELFLLHTDRIRLLDLQKKSAEYYENYLHWSKIVAIFDQMYNC